MKPIIYKHNGQQVTIAFDLPYLDGLTNAEVTDWFNARWKPIKDAIREVSAGFERDPETGALIEGSAALLARVQALKAVSRQLAEAKAAYWAHRQAVGQARVYHEGRSKKQQKTRAQRREAKERQMREEHRAGPVLARVSETGIQSRVNDQRRSAGAFVQADGQTIESRLPNKAKDVTFDANLRRRER